MEHKFYSLRSGKNSNAQGFDLEQIKDLFLRCFTNMKKEGYFDEKFGFYCVDSGFNEGQIKDVEFDMLIKIRKNNLWPIDEKCLKYSEDDLLDVIEFLYFNVSKPIEGTYHGWGECGMHWETFNKVDGQEEYRSKINEIFALYKKPFELNKSGMVLEAPEIGFDSIFEASLPTDSADILSRINAAVLSFRRHGSTLDDRRQAVRDLADVLEYLKPEAELLISRKDEKDLFNIANNFGIRHHNDKQKTNYDAGLWLSWMFYFYLATIHLLLRKIKSGTE